MEDDDGVPGHVAEDGEGQATLSDPRLPDGPGGHEGPGSGGSGEAGAVAREAPQFARALFAPGPNADAEPEPMAGRPRRNIFRFILVVPFRSSLEAQIAYYFLTLGSQTDPAASHREVMVSGRHLAIRLTAEDLDQLDIYISACLHELILLIQTIQNILPPFFPS